MERPENIKSVKATISVRLIILFHLVGVVGLSVAATTPLFLMLVPYHLLLMLLILLFDHDTFGVKFGFFFLLMFCAGFGIEWAGVHTGRLFGNYTYGTTLGFSIGGIPLIMGINWFLLVYSVGVTLQYSRIKYLALRILLGALLLVILDLVIEPSAVKFNYWHWANGVVPVNNYICWFVLGALMLLLFELFRFKKQSIVGVVLLISQFIFFMALLPQPVLSPAAEPIKTVKPR